MLYFIKLYLTRNPQKLIYALSLYRRKFYYLNNGVTTARLYDKIMFNELDKSLNTVEARYSVNFRAQEKLAL